ncbi:MAG: amino acid adenylation domain-containing protein [Pyrinomonadaceae bacterium]
MGDLKLSPLGSSHQTEKFGLTLLVAEGARGLECALSYSTDLFERATAERMARHWRRALEAFAVEPDRRLHEVELLADDERRLLLRDWNVTATEFPAAVCVHEMFEAQATRTPDAVAVVYEDEQLTYAELSRRANRLAHHLISLGVGPESRVAVFLERSTEMIVAVLGALKAGAAYVPVDPATPAGRVRHMLEDAQARVVLTSGRLATKLPAGEAAVVRLDADADVIARASTASPDAAASPDNLAYVIYTSGSTGGAKGVMVTHRSVVNLAASLRARVYPEGERPLRVSVNAPLVFDSSVKQLVQLLYGHALCVVPEEVRRDGDALLAFLRLHEVDVFDCTPSQLRLLLAAVATRRRGHVPALALVGGEAIDAETWGLLVENGRTVFYNVYGPTECTVDTTVCRVGSQSPEPSIGRPLDNVQVYVLDGRGRPTPLGVLAELCVGGEGLGRGYLGRPDLTAERFVPDEFAARPGARLYRTGDLTRYRADGRIDFLGRLDYQVKVRGHRVEPGEVEAALARHPQVLRAVVVDGDDRAGGRRLVAYVVPAPGSALSVVELQRWTKGLLPDYMTPAGWVFLDEVPLTPSGKVDRRALPDPGLARLDTGQSFVAPRTMVEDVLAALWQQLLGVERVGRDDDFFELGGHSLLATRVASRIRESFQVELPVRAVFEAPTLGSLSERVSALMRSGDSHAALPLLPRARAEQSGLSFAQQRLWLIDQLTPGSNAYNLPAAMRLDTELNPEALAQAFAEVVRRHEALRTVFAVAGGQPVQKVRPAGALKTRLVDLSRLPESLREAEAERLRADDALRPFDLAAGPLLRVTLVRLSPRSYLLLACMHHIVSDGWSMGVLMQEVETLYGSFSGGLPTPLEELPVQYADYADWQREWLQGETLRREVEYWRAQLDGAPTLLELETDHPRPTLRTPRGAQHAVAFPEGLARAVREFSRGEGATPFMAYMAAFHALLHRSTGQEDVLVGTPVAGRGRLELEPLIGFFVNMVAVRAGFGDDPSFRTLLGQVREAALGAYAHGDAPFDKLVEELEPQRSPGRNPLFQVVLTYQNTPGPRMQMEGVSLPSGVPPSADTKFDLEVHLWDGPGGVTGAFVYSPELFEPSTVERMAQRFQRLLEEALAEPDAPLSHISLVGEEERRRLVEEWNDTAVPFPSDSCLHELVAAHAAERPDAVALEFEGEHVTYRELSRRAEALALRLHRRGVVAESFVGVMLERSVELVVALLAISKAGAAYVPINLNDPAERSRFILEDAGVSIVLTCGRIAAMMPENGMTVVCVEEVEGTEPAAEAEAVTYAAPSPEGLAYLMYTSGSTGKPKGVMVTHRGIVALVRGANYADLGPDDTFLQLSTTSFDASTFEVWAALLNGARLVLYPPQMPSLGELADFVTTAQVTTLFLTTGLFHQLADAAARPLGAVRQLLTGGEALSPPHAARALEKFPGCRLVNCYGPTEITVMACCHQVKPDSLGASVPIGRPVSNTRVYVLNALEPAGVGERGELYVGGAGVSRGYLDRPDLTADRFVPDPFSTVPGARLYRTGDLARHGVDGELQFLGRADTQVKLNGFRIEPGEVEAALVTHPNVREALVLAAEVSPGNKRLVAYVVPRQQPAPGGDELKSHLRGLLPDYMLPAVCVTLEAMPLTTHGKIDRRALPVPQLSLVRMERQYVAPRDDLQRDLIEIWEELFKVHPISVSDNFFELGGHSLLMVMLITRVEERLGKRVPMAALFREPTVEHMSQLIGQGGEHPSLALLAPLRDEGDGPALFLPHAGGGHVMCYAELARHMPAGRVIGIQARPPESGLVFHTDIEAMAAEYVEAVRAAQPSGPYMLGGWSMGGVIAFEMARRLREQGEEVALLALIDAEAPLVKKFEQNRTILLATFSRDIGLTYENLSKSWDELAALPPMGQLRHVWTDAKAAGLVPSSTTLVEFRRLFDVYKVNVNTVHGYVGRNYTGRVALFRAEQSQGFLFGAEFPADRFENTEYWENVVDPRDPLKGWGKLVTGGVDSRAVPGDHYTVLREPHVRALAAGLSACVSETLERLRR